MCPLCYSKRVRRSRRRAGDFLFLLFRAQPMRCRSCESRFFVWPWSTDLVDPETTPQQTTETSQPAKQGGRSVAAGSGGS